MNNGELPIFHGYMQFSTKVSDTRAHLADNMKGKHFGVIGFKYATTTDWSTVKSTFTPGDWFFNVDVECDTNGTCSYDPMKQWENNKYSFFAYHPYNGSGITLSESTDVNTPMLTYTYSWFGKTGDISLYDSSSPSFDLMTAEAIDVDGSGSGTVTLDFKHRMFAFEILANNYNENSEGTTDAQQKISGLKLTLEGLKYTSMTIPLSMLDNENDKIEYIEGVGVGKRTFKISDEQLTIPAFNETIERTFNGETEVCGAGVETSISKYGSENGGYLFLIPQEESNDGVTGTLTWNELDDFIKDGGEVTNTFNSTIAFEPGILYQIHINFVGDGITIALIEAGAWDAHPDVEHTFE